MHSRSTFDTNKNTNAYIKHTKSTQTLDLSCRYCSLPSPPSLLCPPSSPHNVLNIKRRLERRIISVPHHLGHLLPFPVHVKHLEKKTQIIIRVPLPEEVGRGLARVRVRRRRRPDVVSRAETGRVRAVSGRSHHLRLRLHVAWGGTGEDADPDGALKRTPVRAAVRVGRAALVLLRLAARRAGIPAARRGEGGGVEGRGLELLEIGNPEACGEVIPGEGGPALLGLSTKGIIDRLG